MGVRCAKSVAPCESRRSGTNQRRALSLRTPQALWLWGPTQTRSGRIGWDLPLPAVWKRLTKFLDALERPLVLATGHLGADGRAAFAALAGASDRLICSITHSLYVPLEEALALAANECAFEIDAYTYRFDVDGRRRADTKHHVERLGKAGALVYFTSDGGQASTGNPFLFGSRVLDEIGHEIGLDAAEALSVANPAALLHRLNESPGS